MSEKSGSMMMLPMKKTNIAPQVLAQALLRQVWASHQEAKNWRPELRPLNSQQSGLCISDKDTQICSFKPKPRQIQPL